MGGGGAGSECGVKNVYVYVAVYVHVRMIMERQRHCPNEI